MSSFSQHDPRWSNEILGYNAPDSGGTIGALGCVITAIANLLVKATGNPNFTPSFVNTWGKEHGAFLPDTGIWIWSKTVEIAPMAVRMVSQSSINIDDINAFVTPTPDFVILGVLNGGHYVLVTAVNRILDSADGAVKALNTYGGWKSAHCFVTNMPALTSTPTEGALDAIVTINIPILNARAQPTTQSPVMATAHAGTIHVNGWIVGEEVTVNGRTDNVWLLTDGGHFIAQAGTTRS